MPKREEVSPSMSASHLDIPLQPGYIGLLLEDSFRNNMHIKKALVLRNSHGKGKAKVIYDFE